jgi:hypothetical protein
LSYGLIDDHDWFELYVLLLVSYGALYHASMRDPHCRVLQYVHDSLMVGGVSDRRTNPSKWVVAYGSKEDLIL